MWTHRRTRSGARRNASGLGVLVHQCDVVPQLTRLPEQICFVVGNAVVGRSVHTAASIDQISIFKQVEHVIFIAAAVAAKTVVQKVGQILFLFAVGVVHLTSSTEGGSGSLRHLIQHAVHIAERQGGFRESIEIQTCGRFSAEFDIHLLVVVECLPNIQWCDAVVLDLVIVHDVINPRIILIRSCDIGGVCVTSELGDAARKGVVEGEAAQLARLLVQEIVEWVGEVKRSSGSGICVSPATSWDALRQVGIGC
mmetsp:Transcript_70726/g.147298  ORF Transcript_70726/g.147298 Transcript_70726/m.147298 type:complete len:253 (-) Transcript_70726:569-1327(-)